jgi:outer membrane protein TolC
MVVAAKARHRQLEQERRYLNDRIATELMSIGNDLKAAKRFIQITDKEIKAARTMQRAEKERVDSGASNFFVLNLREEQLADARSRNVQAKATFFKALADYYAATVKTEKLEIK